MIKLSVAFSCSSDEVVVMNVDLDIPVPGAARDLASEVKTAGQIAQIISIFSGSVSSGSALGRVMATRSMVMCDADLAVGGGVIDFQLVFCSSSSPSSATTAVINARSAVISNVVLFAAIIAVLLILCMLWWMCVSGTASSSSTWRSAIAIFCLPSSLSALYMAIIPSTIAGATLLFGRLSGSDCVAGDVLLALLACLMAVLPSVALILLWHEKSCGKQRLWTCSRRSTQANLQKFERKNNVMSAFLFWLRRGLQRQWTWESASNDSSPGWMINMWVILLENRVLWYVPLDALNLVLISCAGVLGGLGDSNTMCYGWTAVVIAVLATQIAMVVMWQPFTTTLSLVSALVTLLLTLLSVVFQLAFLLQQRSNLNSSSSSWLILASAVCNLLIVGITALKMLLDAHQLMVAARRRWMKLQLHRTRRYLAAAQHPDIPEAEEGGNPSLGEAMLLRLTTYTISDDDEGDDAPTILQASVIGSNSLHHHIGNDSFHRTDHHRTEDGGTTPNTNATRSPGTPNNASFYSAHRNAAAAIGNHSLLRSSFGHLGGDPNLDLDAPFWDATGAARVSVLSRGGSEPQPDDLMLFGV